MKSIRFDASGRRPMIFAVCACAMAAALFGCAGPSRSAGLSRGAARNVGMERPGWVDSAPRHSESTLYFVGGSGWRDSETVARQAAVAQASAQIANYFGALVSASSHDVQAVANGADRSEFVLKADIIGTTVTIRGIEQRSAWCKPDSSGYECYVLIAYPVAEYQKAKLEIAAAEEQYRIHQAQNAARALQLYRIALGDEGAKRCPSAKDELKQAAGIIREFKVTLDLDDIALKNTDILARAVADAMTRVARCIDVVENLVAVGVMVNVDDVRSGELENSISSELGNIMQGHGLKTQPSSMDPETARGCLGGDAAGVSRVSEGAAHTLVLEVNSRFSSEIYGQYFARASGRWALLDRDGKVVTSAPFTDEKGAGVTRDSACRDAVRKAWENQIKARVDGAVGGIRVVGVKR